MLLARQNLRLSPSSCLVPVGTLLRFQKLWKVRLVGCPIWAAKFLQMIDLNFVGYFGWDLL